MRNTMLVVALLFIGSALAHAESLTGYEIAKRSDGIPEGTTCQETATMTLVNKKGKSRVRVISMSTKDYGEVKKSVLVFSQPKDVAGVAYLMFEWDGQGRDDDCWLYLPAMKKVRRISGSGKEEDFMGTDFTYDDMGDRGVEKDVFTLLGEEDVDGQSCYKVQAVAKDNTERNPRRIEWFRTSDYLLLKVELYDRQDMLERVMVSEDIQTIDGYPTIGKMTIQNVQTGHKTILEMSDVAYDRNLDDSLFTVATIERGNLL
ncbi:MAG: outer membrane lipoprotein-sorting protein [Sphaerochaetaceae bacterium]|nr:outer membrane lipoprotein-sorting protein [Spirochaetales bacterium]MDY5498887.1 outer membrane lipoprotein-sorting protein [Sphaerochaetaceae bacterium]